MRSHHTICEIDAETQARVYNLIRGINPTRPPVSSERVVWEVNSGFYDAMRGQDVFAGLGPRPRRVAALAAINSLVELGWLEQTPQGLMPVLPTDCP